MAKLKMLKAPKKPKLPKKPGAGASLQAKQNWLSRTKELSAKYHAKVKAVQHENTKRVKINKDSDRLSQVISGIGSIDTLPSGFKSISRRRKKSTATGTRKKKKSAPKKAAKRKTARRR